MTVTVTIDGSEQLVEGGRSVEHTLWELGLGLALTVVKLNGTLLRRQLYGRTVLVDGDAVECVELGARERKIFPVQPTNQPATVKELIGSWADETGYHLTPDPRALNAIVKGLIRNSAKYGAPLCPCMPKEITGDPERDERIACPCVYVDADIAVQGACQCKLFVSTEYHDSMAASLEAMKKI